MKKITLFFAAIIAGFAVQAQDFQAESTSNSTSGTSQNFMSVIWDQSDLGSSGIISDYSNPDAIGVYSADDFELTESMKINTMKFYGFQNLGNLPNVVNGFQLFIYANSDTNKPSGDPTIAGSGIVELDNINTLPIPGYPIVIEDDGEGGFFFIVDMTLANDGEDVILPAGNYWVVAAPRISVSPVSSADERWNWYDAMVPANGINEAHLIDTTDHFGAGATSWTAFSSLVGIGWGSTAFTIDGEPALGTTDNINKVASVYPNPTTDVLNISIPSTIDVKDANLFDVLGQNTGVKLVNGTMNTASLARGIYILTVNTSAGTLTQKIIKK